jgi:hypothetical protein
MAETAKQSSPENLRSASLADIRRSFASMWRNAIQAFSRTDRSAFMSYRRHLVKLVEQLQDEARSLPDQPRYANLSRLATSLEKNIRRMPVIEEGD